MSTEILPALLAEYAELERRMSDPAVHADPGTAREVGRRYAELTGVVGVARELGAARADLEAARELAREAPEFGVEAEALEVRITGLEGRLRELLLPRDPHDDKDVSVAVKARGGGVWRRLKYEGGVHRVQRVPVTESQGRIHTSAEIGRASCRERV